MPALSHNARLEPSIAGVGDYFALLKPRVMSLVVFTALVGLVVAPVPIHPVIGFGSRSRRRAVRSSSPPRSPPASAARVTAAPTTPKASE